jgi:acetylornithine deacetylase/succinyl-diaminopimelate desuccinylase-like protein
VPGTTRDDVDAILRDALGDLFDQVDITVLQHSDPTASGFGPSNLLWETVTRHTQVAYPGADLVPGLIVGGTDARFYRERGITAYGAGLFSPKMDLATFGSRFHGNDERIDVDSLGLSGQLLLRHRQGPLRLRTTTTPPLRSREQGAALRERNLFTRCR